MSPLHQTVIEGNVDRLKDPGFIEQWQNARDNFGFTALEIAWYLGKYEMVKLLGGKLPNGFKLKPYGSKNILQLSLEGFEKALNLHYRPFLRFPTYSSFVRILRQCPYILRSHSLASDNYQWTELYHQELMEGKMASMDIKWIHQDIGYGAFAAEEISKGQFVGEYTGVVRQLYRSYPDQNPYCFHYPTKWWSLNYFVVDSWHEGNLTHFFNHSNQPNLQPLCLIDRRLLRQVFVANKTIRQGEQLTFNYGEDYWLKRTPLRT